MQGKSVHVQCSRDLETNNIMESWGIGVQGYWGK